MGFHNRNSLSLVRRVPAFHPWHPTAVISSSSFNLPISTFGVQRYQSYIIKIATAINIGNPVFKKHTNAFTFREGDEANYPMRVISVTRAYRNWTPDFKTFCFEGG